MRIITMKERDAHALARRRASIAAAMGLLEIEAPLHGGHYRVFGSAAKDEIHSCSDLDILAEFPRESTPRAIRAAERICREHGVPCDVLDRFLCTSGFLQFALPGSRLLPE